MKKFLTLIALLTLVPMASYAKADNERKPAWLCSLEFDATAQGAQILIGYFEMSGYGTLRCASPLTGETVKIPVNVDFDSNPVALKVALGVMQYKGISAQIALAARQPSDLIGTYLVGSANAAVGVGAGAFVATHSNMPFINWNIALNLVGGLGLKVGIEAMTLSRR